VQQSKLIWFNPWRDKGRPDSEFWAILDFAKKYFPFKMVFFQSKIFQFFFPYKFDFFSRKKKFKNITLEGEIFMKLIEGFIPPISL